MEYWLLVWNWIARLNSFPSSSLGTHTLEAPLPGPAFDRLTTAILGADFTVCQYLQGVEAELQGPRYQARAW